VASRESSVVSPAAGLTRKQAVSLLGMNDAEFALRLVWDAKFPKPVAGKFREADIVAWMKAQPAGSTNKSTVRSA
jgi:predicted DNA-binding transcriptional regulator AlpA